MIEETPADWRHPYARFDSSTLTPRHCIISGEIT